MARTCDVGSTPIKISARADDEYWLEFTNRQGNYYNIPLAEVSQSGKLRMGRDETKDLIFEEPNRFNDKLNGGFTSGDPGPWFPIKKKDTFVLSNRMDGENKPVVRYGFTHVMEYESIDTTTQVLTFEDLALGPKETKYTLRNDKIGEFALVVGGTNYKGYVLLQPDYPLAVDLDGEGGISGSSVQIITKGEGIITLHHPDTNPQNFQLDITTPVENFNEPRNDPEIITVIIAKRPDKNQVSISQVNYLDPIALAPTLAPVANDHLKTTTYYGVQIDEYKPVGQSIPEELTLDYPMSNQCEGKASSKPSVSITPPASVEKSTFIGCGDGECHLGVDGPLNDGKIPGDCPQDCKPAQEQKTPETYDLSTTASDGRKESFSSYGKDYELSIKVTEKNAIFTLNGEQTPELSVGQSFVFSDGSKIVVNYPIHDSLVDYSFKASENNPLPSGTFQTFDFYCAVVQRHGHQETNLGEKCKTANEWMSWAKDFCNQVCSLNSKTGCYVKQQQFWGPCNAGATATPTKPTTAAVPGCGNGICEEGEDKNGANENGENDQNCPQDCIVKPIDSEITDTLREGEKKIYSYKGVNHEIAAVFVASQTAGFTIDGDSTGELPKGKIISSIIDGSQIKLIDVQHNDMGGVITFWFKAGSKVNSVNTGDARYVEALIKCKSSGDVTGLNSGGGNCQTEAQFRKQAEDLCSSKGGLDTIKLQESLSPCSGTVTLPITTPQAASQTCTGCMKGSDCLPFGTRFLDGNTAKYCDITKQFVAQKVKAAACQNNYECSSNQCSDGSCVNLGDQIRETQGMLQKILGWFSKVFG